MQHTCFVHFFAVVLYDYNVTLSESSWLQLVLRFMEEVSYVSSLFTFFFSLALIFTLHLVAASISYLLTAATKFSCCSSNEINVSFVSPSPSTSPPPPPVSLSPSPSLSLSLSLPLPLSLSPALSLSFDHTLLVVFLILSSEVLLHSPVSCFLRFF